MRQILVLVLSIFLTCCHKGSKEKEKVGSKEKKELKKQIDAYFSALNEIGKFNGVVFASNREGLILKKAYNINPDKNSTTFVTVESQFDIHSISKLMARYLVAKFEMEGKIRKKQFVDEFFPDFPNGEEITIEMLLDHTSGLPRSLQGVKGNKIDLSSEQILDYAKKQQLLFAPGTNKQYSNVAYQILYFILEKISGKTFAQCLSDEVLQPLGMDNSGAHFYVQEKKLRKLAKNHEKDNHSIIQVPNILPDESKTARIFSTASDLNKFLNHINKEPYASLLKNKDGVIEKSGGSDGIRAQIYTHLGYTYNFVFLANYEAVPFRKTVEDFTKILEKKPYEIPRVLNRKAITLSNEILSRYDGVYAFADMGNTELTFKTENSTITVYQDGERIATLKAESENTFFEDPKEAESFEFIKSEKGDYTVLMGWKGIKLKGIKK